MRLIFQPMCYTVLIEGKNVIMCQMKRDDFIRVAFQVKAYAF